MKSTFVVGITGCSGSGKTFILNSILSHFHTDEIAIVSQDNYYLPGEKVPMDENGIINYDLPESIHLGGFQEDIIKIKQGERLSKMEYTYNNPAKSPRLIETTPAPIIFVEGIFIFSHEIIDNELDYRIYVEAESNIRLNRRIQRDLTERGYDSDDVNYRYRNHVMPAYKKYVEPFRHKADLIIENNDLTTPVLHDLVTFLKTKSR
ncbi:MAG TPA: uridine kinase [Cyclobacteriaceae bacterium]|jgi:uridine kinase